MNHHSVTHITIDGFDAVEVHTGRVALTLIRWNLFETLPPRGSRTWWLEVELTV
jgi:hypothetical protein